MDLRLPDIIGIQAPALLESVIPSASTYNLYNNLNYLTTSNDFIVRGLFESALISVLESASADRRVGMHTIDRELCRLEQVMQDFIQEENDEAVNEAALEYSQILEARTLEFLQHGDIASTRERTNYVDAIKEDCNEFIRQQQMRDDTSTTISLALEVSPTNETLPLLETIAHNTTATTAEISDLNMLIADIPDANSTHEGSLDPFIYNLGPRMDWIGFEPEDVPARLIGSANGDMPCL